MAEVRGAAPAGSIPGGTSSWTVPNVFRVLGDAGQVERAELFRAFNMGVGAVVIAAAPEVERVLGAAAAAGVRAWRLGEVVPGAGTVRFSGGVA